MVSDKIIHHPMTRAVGRGSARWNFAHPQLAGSLARGMGEQPVKYCGMEGKIRPTQSAVCANEYSL